jgi:Protein of unknown function (DUF3829)
MPRVHKFCATLAALIIAGASCAQAQTPPPDSPAGEADDSGLKAVTLKFNAYVGFMNRTLRAAQSIDRYKSWVNMKTGPTGRESIIYGLYEVYDTTREAAAATAALTQEPLLPELDAAMRDYIAANGALAPILNEASAYYDRKDYKDDKMAGGIALHTRIVAAAGPFLAARARLDAIFTAEKAKVDAARLAAIEKREGRKANWHVANVMMRAQRVMDLLPSGAKPVVEIGPLDAAILEYAGAVKDMDTYGASNPNSFFVFESQPRGLLSKPRDFQEKIDRAKGDARRGGGSDLTWIINDYNSMVSSAPTATQFSR